MTADKVVGCFCCVIALMDHVQERGPVARRQRSRSGSAIIQETPGSSASLGLRVLHCSMEVTLSSLPASPDSYENMIQGQM